MRETVNARASDWRTFAAQYDIFSSAKLTIRLSRIFSEVILPRIHIVDLEIEQCRYDEGVPVQSAFGHGGAQ